MSFDTYKELVEYYESYAKQEGFAVFKRSTSTTDDGEKRYGTLTCSREGQRASRSKNEFRMKPTSGTNCKARLNVIIGSDGKCLISSFFLKHNHSLSPNKSRFFRSNRVIISHIKRKLKMNDIAGIRPNKSYRSIVVEAGGPENVPFLEKDCRNFLDKVRRLRLGQGDATAVNEYFPKRFEKMCNAFHEVADMAMEEYSKCTRVMGWINNLKAALSVEDDVSHESGPLSTENEVHINEPVAKNSAENVKISSPLVVRANKDFDSQYSSRPMSTNVQVNQMLKSSSRLHGPQQWSEHQSQQGLPTQQTFFPAQMRSSSRDAYSTPFSIPNSMLMNMSFSEMLAIQQQPPQHQNVNHVVFDVQSETAPHISQSHIEQNHYSHNIVRILSSMN
ncbi:hypothetical protein POM88_028333 [Heracleum sosnowskyi]|uniref:FAR1 domain-containing protein n=1 Tax=Heracleum sosnowskyi TaxID=360622 RepID=A0AAD8MR19_9APIA|nr:hypothetical protein POM88_028333 [Heracleum sosnowskyi]